MTEAPDTDPYAGVPPPSPDDGPQEPVDWRELEEATHPTIPDEREDLTPVDLVPIDESKDQWGDES
jgi:hypothetical protein